MRRHCSLYVVVVVVVIKQNSSCHSCSCSASLAADQQMVTSSNLSIAMTPHRIVFAVVVGDRCDVGESVDVCAA